MYLRLPRVCDKLHSFKEQIANPWLVKIVSMNISYKWCIRSKFIFRDNS